VTVRYFVPCFIRLLIFNGSELQPISDHATAESNIFKRNLEILLRTFLSGGPGSSVGIATDYGLDGPGTNPGGDEIFRPSKPALGPNQPPVQWVLGLSWG